MKSLTAFISESLESDTQIEAKQISENSNIQTQETENTVSENNESSGASEEK